MPNRAHKHLYEARIPEDEAQAKRIPLETAMAQGLVERIDPAPQYLTHIADLVDIDRLKGAGLAVLADSMWGNGAGWFARILSGGSTHVTEIHGQRNPIFPEMQRPEPIPPNVNVGLQATLAQHADVLLITDGYADRVGLCDEQGRFVDQLRVFALLAFYLLETRGERGPIVKTLSTTSMLDKLGRLYNVPVYETGVGFKYVAPKMLEVDAMIGGEESGGYAFRNHVPERDGILAGLLLLDAMVRERCKPSELVERLFAKVGAHYYDRVDTRMPPENRAMHEARIRSADPSRIGGLRVTGLNDLDGFKYGLEDGGWLLIRFSGTEPIVRVYCETTHADRVQALLDDGLRIVGLK